MTTDYTLSENENLQDRHFYHFPVYARYFAAIHSAKGIESLVQDHGPLTRPMVLGEGSNVFFSKDYDGCLLHPMMDRMHHECVSDGVMALHVEAGVRWDDCVQYAVSHGWYGLERLSLIPGTVGASPAQNIGAYGGQLSDVFHACETVNCLTGERQSWGHADCQFAYRSSVFQKMPHLCITSLTLHLRHEPSDHPYYHDVEALRQMHGLPKQLSAKEHRDLVVSVRRRKIPDPTKEPNTGSFFKNPILPHDQAQDLLKRWPDVVGWPVSQGMKLSAAWLIEQAGFKGYRQGSVRVSDRHALVLVHEGGGQSDELTKLYQAIQEGVHQRFGVLLSPEVQIR